MSAIPFVREMRFDYEVCDSLWPGIRRVIARNPSEFTLYGTNTFILGESGPLAIVDPGPASQEHVDAVLNAVDGAEVSHIFVTHTHRDHSPAADILAAETGAATCGYGPHPTGRKEDGGGAPVEDGPDLTFVPQHRLADGETVAGPDWEIEAVHTPGHMSNHMCYALAGRGILFSGDHVMAWATSVISPPDGCLLSYMNSLNKVLGRPEAIFLPSHGPAIEDPETVVAAHIAHRDARTRQILDKLAQGPAKIPEIVEAIYEELDPRLIQAARLSVLAHLIYLRKEGLVAAQGPDDWQADWRLP